MKKIILSDRFIKNFAKRILPNMKLVSKYDERVEAFITFRYNPILKNHKLSGRKAGLCSFSITGDVRVIYKEEEEYYKFLDIGTHNQVYN